MASNIVQRFAVAIGGQPIAFASPFAAPLLELAEAPAQYEVVLEGAAIGTLWDGAPLPDDFDVLIITSDQSLDVEFTVDEGNIFTLFVRAGGFPTVLQGSESYDGALGTTLGNITSIRAQNRNTTDPATVSVLLGKAST